ncbi:MAG: MBL fold metallo-hydrolase, partial [Desulfobacterales bacterium]|nr:MBL fold metallo-hydrolase [Desulfobacterales bacterium]
MDLLKVDRLEILIVTDNYADSLLESAPGVHRRITDNNGWLPTDTVLAEHGICLLLTAWKNDRKVGLIFDAGFSPIAAPRNLDFLAEALDHVQAMAISHAHEDHIGATSQLLKMAGKPPLVLHPECFFHPRYWKDDNGKMLQYPEMLNREDLQQQGFEIVENSEPSLVGEACFMLTGEIPRITDFEHALPGSVKEVKGKLVPDLILDDQAAVVDIEGHGLVIVSGCGHAGIVNTIQYARAITDGRPLYALMGGFHLPGRQFRSAIEPTLQAIKAEYPKMVIPMHCTGVEAKALMRHELGSV